mmetsp:Transcript_38922/g.93641  ORF Transcript_38922/g.93641 Transcript_38922/m.93641 type:complete len:121 (+) Transcript_38922:378-740(+)
MSTSRGTGPHAPKDVRWYTTRKNDAVSDMLVVALYSPCLFVRRRRKCNEYPTLPLPCQGMDDQTQSGKGDETALPSADATARRSAPVNSILFLPPSAKSVAADEFAVERFVFGIRMISRA